MSFCIFCGAQMPEGAKFCTNCGAPVQQAAPAGRSIPQPEVPPQQNYTQGYAQQPYQQPNYAQQGFAQPYQQPNYAQQGFSQPYQQPQPGYYAAPQPGYGYAPAKQLKTNRGLLKLILLSIITLGIYGIVVMSGVSTDINIVASRYDGRKTMHFCLVLFIFSWLTCGIVPLVWYHRISDRIGTELARRGIDYNFGAGTFWGWGFFGVLILVGPFIYTYKLLKSMNLLCADYNVRG